MPPSFTFSPLTLTPSADGSTLFSLHNAGLDEPLTILGPAFEVDGAAQSGFRFVETGGEREIPGGGREVALRYANPAGLELRVTARGFFGSPVLRFRCTLRAPAPARLTKTGGADRVTYFALARPGLEQQALTEVQLSHFEPVLHHAFRPNRVERAPAEALPGLRFAGPLALFHGEGETVLAAYEHGADHPDSFFDFVIEGEEEGARRLALVGRKGNYYHGQPIGPGAAFESAWFELGLRPGGLSGFLPAYRRFLFDEISENRVSRQPRIFYNTWNYQERQKYFAGQPYLESMNAGRMLAEIDAAHRLGVDVFVVDTGWYRKTGDWLPDPARFPERLAELKRRLDGYGMQLGLWFNPTVAALTSQVFQAHPEWEMEWQGQPRRRAPVWETEESAAVCLASDYADEHIELLVRLHDELGVDYYKWDGVQQYGCDSPHHNHGTAENTPQERADCYAYQMGLSMIRIVNEVSRRCPGVMFDFDITEAGRFVGLGFLSASRYYYANNGPYFSDFDIPRAVKIEPDTINVFFYPGAAHPRVNRTGILYDEVIPASLFMTHYLTDGPDLARRNALAALMLGGHGLWGDLVALSEAEQDEIGAQVRRYKRAAEGAVRAAPRSYGFIGSSPEIYEKISPAEPLGVVVFFTANPGEMIHTTQPLNGPAQVTGADAWEALPDGRLRLAVRLERNDARVVYIEPR